MMITKSYPKDKHSAKAMREKLIKFEIYEKDCVTTIMLTKDEWDQVRSIVKAYNDDLCKTT